MSQTSNPDHPSEPLADSPFRTLSSEHVAALSLAEQLTELAADGSPDALREGIRRVQEYYDQALEAHLQQEEQTLFAPLLRHDPGQLPLIMRLGKEHGLLRTIATTLNMESAARDLGRFADVLREHTHAEDATLLPLVASVLTPEEQAKAAQFKPISWNRLT